MIRQTQLTHRTHFLNHAMSLILSRQELIQFIQLTIPNMEPFPSPFMTDQTMCITQTTLLTPVDQIPLCLIHSSHPMLATHSVSRILFPYICNKVSTNHKHYMSSPRHVDLQRLPTFSHKYEHSSSPIRKIICFNNIS